MVKEIPYMITYESLIENKEIKTYIERADSALLALGYTEHSFAHAAKVASAAKYILEELGFSERECELAKISALLHDIGNLANRENHSTSGALMAFVLLRDLGMDPAELSSVVAAIGNHDEGTGNPIDAIAAALILADKSDVRRSRVRNLDRSAFDIHDRVNYSAEESRLTVDRALCSCRLDLKIDTSCGSVMDYFEIFMERMQFCRKAAEALGLRFELAINEFSLI